MKQHRILLTVIFLIGVSTFCEGLFHGISFQDYVENFVDKVKVQMEGTVSLNDSAMGDIWSYFKLRYDRVYSSFDEERQRLRIFRDHVRYVFEANLLRLRTFQLELNEFSDWTLEEFDILKKGLIVSTSLRRKINVNDNEQQNDQSLRRSLKKFYQQHYYSPRLKRGLRDRRFFLDWFKKFFGRHKKTNHSAIFDWRAKGLVSSVKNQRKCGCCYAFATATILETLYAVKTNSPTITEFSPQQLADCSSNGNNGCHGGHFAPSVRYILEQGGKIATEASYPYVGKKQTCKTNNLNQVHLGNIEYGPIPEGDEVKLAEALQQHGPIFIGLDADSRLFMFYKTGVLKITNCPNRRQDMDHAMVIVGHGYDYDLQIPYWTIKNSWGTKWGEDGYLRLAKDSGNMCGVASMAYYGKLI